MGRIITDHVAWVLTFLGILASIMTAAILDIRGDIMDMQVRLVLIENKLHMQGGDEYAPIENPDPGHAGPRSGARDE